MAGGLFQFSLFEVLANHRGARIICAEFVGISFSQSIHQLLMKIVMPCSYWRRDAFVVHLARPIDVFPQPIVKVTAAAAVLHFRAVEEQEADHVLPVGLPVQLDRRIFQLRAIDQRARAAHQLNVLRR